MGLAADLFTANRDGARACLSHPFVRGLADGDLPAATFRIYVAQDAYYLHAFARAYALAAARCPDQESFDRLLELMKGVADELRLHAGYAAELGIDLTNVSPMPETLAYTDFLLATAWSSTLGETLAAMTPCMRLYAWLGQELACDGLPDHAYRSWIETYSSPELAELADVLDGLLDRYGSDVPEVRAAYERGMSLEFRFFDACWRAGEAS